MKRLLSLFATTLLLSNVQAQTADEIINKHIEAIGGKDVVNSIKSMVLESEISVMGSTLSSTTQVVTGKGFRNEAVFNGMSIIQVVTPDGGWQVNPLAGMTSPEKLGDDEVKGAQSSFDTGGELFNYQEKGSKVELLADESIQGVNHHKIKLTDKYGNASTFFIDASTHYITKRESSSQVNGTEVTATSTFSDYKKTDSGFVIPFTTVTNQGFEMTITVKKAEFNKELDPSIFTMPK